MRVVSDERLAGTTSINPKLIIVEDLIAEMVRHFLNREMIVQGQAATQDKALDNVIEIKFVAIVDVGLLREELSRCLSRHNELIHHIAHCGIINAISGACVRRQGLTRVDQEEPLISFGGLMRSQILKLYRLTLHVGAIHVVQLLIELHGVILARVDLSAWYGQVVRKRAVCVDLHPGALHITVDVSLYVFIERVQAVCDKQLLFGDIIDGEMSVS